LEKITATDMKLSIITINYNNKQGLIKTFESVKSQSWNEFEYIVIDGGSSDGSKELIESNPQVSYWVSEKDSGVYNALNKGIKAANGDYLIFMNSGDSFYNSDVLKNVAPNFTGEISVLYGNSMYYKEDGYQREEVFPKKLTFSFFYTSGINHQAAFIKRDLFFKYFLYNEQYKIFADWELFVYAICAKNEPYLHLDQIICYYDFTGMSSNMETYNKYLFEKKATIEKYFPLFAEDYILIDEFQHKRMKDLVYIKQFKFPWFILKSVSKLILIFLPKKKNN
jgi:glycosyltransferase involved in cell wall biosynthesis